MRLSDVAPVGGHASSRFTRLGPCGSGCFRFFPFLRFTRRDRLAVTSARELRGNRGFRDSMIRLRQLDLATIHGKAPRARPTLPVSHVLAVTEPEHLGRCFSDLASDRE